VKGKISSAGAHEVFDLALGILLLFRLLAPTFTATKCHILRNLTLMMCPSDSTHQAHSSMTESSRTRSDSLEASSSQQNRKRPRLDSGHNDSLRSEEALTDSGFPGVIQDPDSPNKGSTGSTCLNNSPSPSALSMEPSSNGPLSKVTINTRSAANNASNALDGSVDQSGGNSSPRTLPRTSPRTSPVAVSTTCLDSASGTDMVAQPPDTVTIPSSPSQSPEIQIAVVEDIDQDPAETSWTPVTRLTDSVLLQQQATPHHVRRTFPYAQNAQYAPMHEILMEISKTFLQGWLTTPIYRYMSSILTCYIGGERDGFVFIQVKEWLVNFLEIHPQVTQRQVHEEKAFWEEFPEVVHSLLRRL
jgi:ubiquitin carboxyl-terminal hydrolase 34